MLYTLQRWPRTLHAQQRGHGADDRRVLRRAAGHRPDPAIEELVLDLGDLLELEVLVEREALASCAAHRDQSTA
ncbi:MAG TPA: hypothetical protein VFK02_26050 [Kofleriaceae bacterium]|nr:hypothetical protein [Kofleriaceae bacterium]